MDSSIPIKDASNVRSNPSTIRLLLNRNKKTSSNASLKISPENLLEYFKSPKNTITKKTPSSNLSLTLLPHQYSKKISLNRNINKTTSSFKSADKNTNINNNRKIEIKKLSFTNSPSSKLMKERNGRDTILIKEIHLKQNNIINFDKFLVEQRRRSFSKSSKHSFYDDSKTRNKNKNKNTDGKTENGGFSIPRPSPKTRKLKQAKFSKIEKSKKMVDMKNNGK